MTVRIFKIIFVLFIFMFAKESQAKEDWDFLRLTCIPGLDYFSIQTLYVDLEDNDLENKSVDIKLKKYNVTDPGKLIKNPYICNLPRGVVKAQVTGYSGCAECGAKEIFDLTISLDDKKIYEVPAYSLNDSLEPVTHFIELGDVERDCVMPQYIGDLTCKRINQNY